MNILLGMKLSGMSSICCKSFEHILVSKINILDESQHGCDRGSCETRYIEFIHAFFFKEVRCQQLADFNFLFISC